MSGFEIAGVVLGSIPLIISALEHYAEGVAVMKNMKEYECVFDDIHTDFSASVLIFQNSCFQLLRPLNLSDQETFDLLMRRSPSAWKSPGLQNDLEKRLGPNYRIYLSLISKLNRRILLFCRKLKLDDDLKPPWVDQNGNINENARKKFFGSAWTRIKGGFSSNKFAELLQIIDNDIAKISRLTTRGMELESMQIIHQNEIYSTHWEHIRDQAQRLFESLSSRFYPCSCHHPHKAELQLDFRKSDSGEEAARFAFLLTFEKSKCGTRKFPWEWRDIEIETSLCSNTLTAPNSTPPVRFVTTTTAPAHPSPAVSSTVLKTATTSAPSGLPSKINNLCRDLTQCYNVKYCIGFLEDQSWQHHVYCVPGPGSSNQISDLIPVKEIIYGNISRMSTIDKYTLASTLASAVLQLYNTPWLPTAWSSDDILMLETTTGSTLLSQFYVSQTFDSAPTKTVMAKRHRLVKNEMVFALGVALLELSYGQPLLSLQTPEDLNDQGLEDSMTEFSIATRLAYQIHEREMDNYAKSVLRCVTCNFDTYSCDFENRGFREKFFNGVVAP